MEAMTQPGEVRVAACAAVGVRQDGHRRLRARAGGARRRARLHRRHGAPRCARPGSRSAPIEDFTGFPEIMGGRVKTLHPKLYAGLLALRDDPEHMAAADEHEVEFVDLVCVNLYPFEAHGARGAA